MIRIFNTAVSPYGVAGMLARPEYARSWTASIFSRGRQVQASGIWLADPGVENVLFE